METELLYAVQIAAGDYDHPLLSTCLKRTVEIAVAGARDPRWTSEWSTARTINRGGFASASALAQAWNADTHPDRQTLATASEEMLIGAQHDRPAWTELAQSEYMHGIQLLLITEDLQQAAKRLDISRNFSRIQHYWDWQSEFVALLATRNAGDSARIRAHFDSYFDYIRNPFFEPHANDAHGYNVLDVGLMRLRLALIRWIYIERQPIAGNWRHIIGQIGY